MEWLFFTTKPSFLGGHTLVEQLGVLGTAPLFFLPWTIATFALVVVAHLLSFDKLEFRRFTLLSVTPAAIATIVSVLLLDNFTYTVFRIGIVTTGGDVPYLYLLLVILIWGGWCTWFTGKIRSRVDIRRTRRIGFTLLSLSLIGSVSILFFTEQFDPDIGIETTRNKLPDIIIFSSDGIEASHVSTYGYHRNTTPNLDALAADAMVVYNAIPNAGRTTGSTTAILSGKFPTTTKVIFPPHTLQGRDSYQHLPGILKKLGYLNIQESVRYYADSRDLNMRAGFDYANGRRIDEDPELSGESFGQKFTLVQLFVERTWIRIKSRALHLIQHTPMENAFDIVNPDNIAKVYGITDNTRINRVLKLIKETEKPFFAQIHLMESHCCKYLPAIKKFSAEHRKQNPSNVFDFFDDVILSADNYFGRLLAGLREANRFDNAIIIYTSDHTRVWRTTQSVPLVVRFPGGEYAGKKAGMSQLLDIAPTIVDYLGLPKMKWMEGRSLLGTEAEAPNTIFTVGSVNRKRIDSPTDALKQLVGAGPPLYGLKTVTLVDCRQSHILDAETGELDSEKFNFQAEECETPVAGETAKQLLESHLVRRGFELPYL